MKHGDPTAMKKEWHPAGEQSFLAKIRPDESGCILWIGSTSDRGYGKMGGASGHQYAHRYAWVREHGPIPEGLHIDHVCRVRHCVNVEHLRLATNKQNHENLSGARSDSRSRVRGAVWSSQKGKYAAQVHHYGKRYHIGFYEDPEEAGRVAASKRAELFTHH